MSVRQKLLNTFPLILVWEVYNKSCRANLILIRFGRTKRIT